MGLKTLKLIPIFQKKVGKLKFRLGGSFLKLPKLYMNWMINQSLKQGFIPHFYMHPYEFGNSENFKLKNSDLKILGLKKSIYWQLRQFQWLKIRNNILHEEIKILFNKYELEGTLANKIYSEVKKDI